MAALYKLYQENEVASANNILYILKPYTCGRKYINQVMYNHVINARVVAIGTYLFTFLSKINLKFIENKINTNT